MKLFELKILIIIILLGGFFRFYNLNWDEGHFFHPDERNIANSVSQIRFFSQMNPHFFAYGSFPIYLYRVTGDILNFFFKEIGWTYEWGKINIVGRAWSAFFSTLTFIFLYKLSKKIFDKKVALVAIFLTAFTPFLIQTAHFAVTESLLSFWIVLITYFSIQLLLDKKSSAQIAFQTLKIALASGLALATKVSAATFLLPPTVAFLYFIIKNLRHKNPSQAIEYGFKILALFSFSTLIFLILNPFVLLDFQHFKESMNYEGGIVSGKLVVVYVYQFIKTMPYLYWLKNWSFTQGPLLAAASIIGWLYVIFLTIKKRKFPLFLLIIWPIVYFVIVGHWFTKFVRYLVPLYPFLALFAAKLLVDLKKTSKFLFYLTLSTTFFYALAFMSIYRNPQTRITASKWVYANVPAGAKILTEHWDDGLPLPLNNYSFNSQYEIEQLTIYEPDNQQKLTYYAEKLAGADYVILNSRRLYGTLMYLPEKYPITSKYYKFLFAGKLGYNKIAEFSSYPKLFGISMNDDASEETFQVYDHPKVLIFKNVKKFNNQEIKNILLTDNHE